MLHKAADVVLMRVHAVVVRARGSEAYLLREVLLLFTHFLVWKSRLQTVTCLCRRNFPEKELAAVKSYLSKS